MSQVIEVFHLLFPWNEYTRLHSGAIYPYSQMKAAISHQQAGQRFKWGQKMAFKPFFALVLLVMIPSSGLAAVAPDPTFDCTNPNFRVIYTACSAHNYSRCCAVGTSCCAGGCCDLLSNCLNVGTDHEVCCPANDPTACGFLAGSGTTPPYAVQSVVCTGSDGLSSYYCPPGATCNSATDSCIGGSGSSGSGGGGGSSGSSSAGPSGSSGGGSTRVSGGGAGGASSVATKGSSGGNTGGSSSIANPVPSSGDGSGVGSSGSPADSDGVSNLGGGSAATSSIASSNRAGGVVVSTTATARASVSATTVVIGQASPPANGAGSTTAPAFATPAPTITVTQARGEGGNRINGLIDLRYFMAWAVTHLAFIFVI